MRTPARALAWAVLVGVGCTETHVPEAPDPRAAEKTASSTVEASAETATAAGRPEAMVNVAYSAMGTRILFQAWTNQPERARGAFEAAMAEFRRLEDLHSNWRPNSDVSRLNARAGVEPVSVSEETIELLELAKAMHRTTRGKFDVTFGALSDLWRFDHDQDNRIPDAEVVKARLPLVDASRLQYDRRRGEAFLPVEGMTVHFGGIGKGYAVDRAVEVLRGRGLENFMIQAGGDLFASGQRGSRPWRVGIRDPRGPPDRFFAMAEVEDRTFSTSGDYERFFVKDGVRYHHILDPHTGRPARGVRSVTVLAPRAVLADVLSTAVFVLGPESGMDLVESLPGVAAVMVTEDNRVIVSERAKGRVRILGPPTP